MTAQNDSSMEQLDKLGERVPLTCPECGGTLWEMENGGPRFRCHTGHAFSLATLADEQASQVEAALWAAVRRLEEAERLALKMTAHARVGGDTRSVAYHADLARSHAAHAATLRDLLSEKSTAGPQKAVND